MSDENNDNGTSVPQSVPYDRFQSVVSSKNELSTQVQDLQSQIQALTEKAATVDTLGAQLREMEQAKAKVETDFQRYTTVASELGTTDPDVYSAVQWQYSRIQGEDRPEFGEWVASLKAEPEKAPAILRPFIPGRKEDEVQVETKKPAPRRVQGQSPPQAAPQVTADAIRRAREKAHETGDWSAYKRLKEAMNG